jgi:hypothetical protein
MSFPPYVPNAVRTRVTRMLEGPRSLSVALEHANAALTRLNELRTGNPHDDRLRIQHSKALAHRDHLAAEVACCQRLVHDARMQDAYSLLATLPNVTDSHLSGFIDAAWAAHMDYAKHRDRVKAAGDLARQVAEAAGVLADLLRKAEGFADPLLPSEFFSIKSLLEKTEHGCDDRDFHMWPGMRRYLLGQRDLRSTPADESVHLSADEAPTEIEILNAVSGAADALSSEDEQRDMLHYAWGTVPNMARIIATMQREALAYVPTVSGAIGAALASRKRNAKAEYLRAFGALLRDDHCIDCTAKVINAMAITASVVLNDPDDDVTPGDVRSALIGAAA